MNKSKIKLSISRGARRRSARFLKRHIIGSDDHGFIGRIFDLGVVSMHFDTSEDLERHPDCKYVLGVNYWVSRMVSRVESLNLVGEMLWPDPLPTSFDDFPITSYDWLNVAVDAFLIRYVSIVDCALIVVSEVYQLGLIPKKCTIGQLRKLGVAEKIVRQIELMLKQQEHIREERNSRIHHGIERKLSGDDLSFSLAARFSMRGLDRHDRPISVERSFQEALISLQRDFSRSTRLLEKQLDPLYDMLWEEFEARFGPMISAACHRINAQARVKG